MDSGSCRTGMMGPAPGDHLSAHEEHAQAVEEKQLNLIMSKLSIHLCHKMCMLRPEPLLFSLGLLIPDMFHSLIVE